MANAAVHAPLDLRTAEAMLQFVAGCEDRETWLAVGMGLKREFGPEAFDAWDRWSTGARNYDAKAVRAVWKSFNSANAGGYTIATVIKFAKDGGYRWEPGQRPDPEEVARRRMERDAAQAREAAIAQARQAAAEDVALVQWRAAQRTGSSDYLLRKGIDAESVRFAADGALLVPMLRYDLPREQSLKGLQAIRADGQKRFTPGMAKAGTACRLGLHSVGQPIIVCEGYATGMSIRMATERRFAVVVAFDAYNLPGVALSMWQQNQDALMVLAADDDWKTQISGAASNVGRTQVALAAEMLLDAGAKCAVRTAPVFAPRTPRSDKDTDFNDLHRLEGLPEVREQILNATEMAFELRAQYG
jgi:putative DNA primase/helicase